MDNRRVFTIEEVDALIPTFSHLVSQQLLEQSEIERRLADLARTSGKVPSALEPEADDSPEALRLKGEVRDRIARYEDGWRKIADMGAVIKDPQIGLLDFYGRVEGRLVWLCWKYGEDSLGYYHELDAGYSGRRPLRAELRERLLN